MKRIGLVLLLIGILFVGSGITTYAFRAHAISREDLGISADAANQTNCQKAQLALYPPHTYNQELGANDYLLYAIASLNAYEDETITRFTVERAVKEFVKVSSPPEIGGGLHYNIYYRGGDDPEAIIAFRGTRPSKWQDWFANLSWFTGILPMDNAYDLARDEFKSIRGNIAKRAEGRPVKYVVTGHSLGGAIAQHIAYGFPCVSAVVFDTSPVINKFWYSKPFDDAIIVHLRDRKDELTRFSHFLFMREEDTETYRWYPLDLNPPGTFKHNITRLAVGMAGMAAHCQLDRKRIEAGDCQIPADDTRAQDAYCATYGETDDEICPPVRRRLGLPNSK